MLRHNFEAKFFITPSCWVWTAAKTRQGYGQFGYKGMMTGAHRVSFELYRELIPKGLFVLHRCNNASCVNPDHLYLGTNADNMLDRKNSGRTYKPKGTAHHNSVFSEEQLKLLKEMYATGVNTHRALAFKFRVSKTTVSYALKGTTYQG